MKELKEYMEAKKKANASKVDDKKMVTTLSKDSHRKSLRSLINISRGKPQRLEEVTLKAIYGTIQT